MERLYIFRKDRFYDRPRRFSILFAKTDLPDFMTDLADSQMDFADIETDLADWKAHLAN